MGFLLNHPIVARQKARMGQGDAVVHIYPSNLAQVVVPLPPLDEQRAIAAALADVDALLANLDARLAKQRALKTAAMQQLLTGRTRLPGFSAPWATHDLGERGTFSKGKGIKKDDLIAEGIPCIRYGEIYTSHNDYIKHFYSFIASTTAGRSHRIKSGDLLFAGSGETSEEIGKCVAYLGNDDVYAGGDVIIFTPRQDDSQFLGFLLNHPIVAHQKAQMGQGDAVVHIYPRNLALLQISVPPLDEQHAIAAVVSDMDAAIAALEAQRAKTADVKQAMMQDLLTGRIRLR